MDILIQKLNGETKKFSELGWIVKDIIVSSTDIRAYTTEIQGKPGSIDKGADHGGKTVTVPFVWKAKNLLDYSSKRDELYYWLGGIDAFYIFEGRSLGKSYQFVDPGTPGTGEGWKEENQFISGKRYLVRRTGGFSPEQSETWGETQIEFGLVGLPFGETPVTTMDPKNLFYPSWLEDRLGIEPELLRYTVDSPTIFRVYNGGTEPVSAEESMDFNITYKGPSEGLRILNRTNGTRFKYNGVTEAGDVLEIKGIEVYKNGQSVVRDTDLDLLVLEPGWNRIDITGVNVPFFVFLSPHQTINTKTDQSYGEITFDFRWYFR